jgi:hypothetical protein
MGFGRVVGKPGFSKAARVFGFGYPIAIDMQLDIIAGTAAERTDGMGDDTHHLILHWTSHCPHGAVF